MRTDVAKNSINAENIFIDPPKGKSSDEHKAIKGMRRTLQPLQKTAGRNENLVGAGKSPAPSNDKISVVAKKAKQAALVEDVKKTVTGEDLTTEGQPSAEYWEALAERRRIALEKALLENQRLTEKVAALEEENTQAQALLVESRQIIETLTELLNEGASDDEEKSPK